jgi:hypothetical protein
VVDEMDSFSSGDLDLGFPTVGPWLRDLQHINSASFRRLSKVLPSLDAKIVHLTGQPPSDTDSEGDDKEDAPGDVEMDVSQTAKGKGRASDVMVVSKSPSKPPPAAPQQMADVVLASQVPGVRMFRLLITRLDFLSP